MTRTRRALLAALTVSSMTAARLEAVVPPNSPVAEKQFRHANLHIPIQNLALQQLPEESAGRIGSDIGKLGLGADSAFYDPRAGRLASLIVSVPLVPGTGVGNDLKWVSLGGEPRGEIELKEAVWTAVLGYLQQNAAILRVDTSELSAPRINVFEHGNIIQVYSQRVVNGVPVRDSSLTANLNHGNLVLLGLQNWGDLAPNTAAAPQIAALQGQGVIAQHAQPHVVEGWGKDSHLEYIPMVNGDGYEYRLVWAIRANVRGDQGTWEGLVDAVTGELVAFEDRNQYVARKAMGGVYPISNDQRLPDGVEQAGWPMPYLNVTTPAGTVTTNAGGTIGCVTGTVSTQLIGQFARMADQCGAINETSATGDLDLGFGPTPTATDCVVPAGHSAGDTKASRTGFYELTRINEQARGYLPANPWLQTSLIANMNIPSACNAFWNGASVNFYRDSAQCRNTGEQAAIFDHEWGHGMDNNGTNPNIAGPGEGIADIHAFVRLNTSCVGRGFFKNQTCGGYGDQCIGTTLTGCTGVRDIDWNQRRCNLPHTITYITNGFTAAQCAGGAPACPAGAGTPCGRATHCEGYVVAESAFDLARRDLPAAGFDANTSHELTTRLFFLGSQAVTAWYTCNAGGGCGATGGYLQVLAADDDNGNINDGTPHMVSIRAAFERHETHCATPAAVNSGCAGGPATAPVVTFTAQDQGVTLNWGAVTGAARYYVYRTEGVNGDTFGKVKIAEVTGTTFTDTNLQNGRTYYFTVLPVGTNTSCFGRMSASATVIPTPGANAAVRSNFTYTRTGGDNDSFLDNCERADVTITVENTGTGPLTNVRISNIVFLDHPTSILITPTPIPVAATLADCATANGTFAFTLQGATFGQSTRIRVDVTADNLPAGQVRSQILTINNLETNETAVATRTFNFDTDLQGWTVLSGTPGFFRQAGGAQGTPFHVSSSEAVPDNCDAIRSPAFIVTANSTLSLFSRYDIEPTDPVGGPYDRANVGLRDVGTGVRTVVIPSGGQLYTLNPGAINGTCEQTGQAGWNAQSNGYPTFNQSTWSSAAFNPGGSFTGRVVSLEIRYGTDPLLHPNGFDFDQVVLTNFSELAPDTLPNTCVAQAAAPAAIAIDSAGNGVFEPNEGAVSMAPTWQNTGTNAIALTGALSNFTGPAPATYTIVDGAASYGTIGVGAQASCTAANNCYSLSVAATARPITHWDSTVLETVNPSATTKNWTLHIGASFIDVPVANPFYRFVETILHHNVTGGCSPVSYCPQASTSREQMAVFVLVSSNPTAPPPAACVVGSEAFSDVPAVSPFCRWIEELARRGVVTGCGGSNYCPTASATREQMAVFVLRTLDPTLNPAACGTPVFSDVPASSPFCRWIEELVRRGVVTGCGGGAYCPTADVSREQMSVFLAVTFSLQLYGL